MENFPVIETVNQMIDIDQTIKDLNAINSKNLFAQLLDMSISELRSLKKTVRSRKKTDRLIKDESLKPNGSIHDVLIAMAGNAIAQKSAWQHLDTASFPIKKTVFWLFGFTLKQHPYLGTCRKHRNRKLLTLFKKFWLAHWKWLIGLIVSTILAMAGLYLTWLSIIKT